MAAPPARPPDAPPRRPLVAYGRAVGAPLAATALGLPLFPYAGLAEVTMLYLLAIALASLGGRGPALLAASLSVALLNVAFIPPRFTFRVADARHLLTFATMFASGLMVSSLTGRLRRQERAARDAALRARTEELRSSLLSAVSHDLRTPLAVITGAATTLRDHADQLDPAARAELLASIVEDARRLERVLGSLLQLTRVESGMAPAREWIPAEEIVGGALTRLEDALGARAVELDVPPDVLAHVDPVLTEQLVINLVENALKHGAPPIAIAARTIEHGLELSVRDHGPGIPATIASTAFDRFVRASAGPGAGLGLAVVRAIALAHGGEAVAEAAPGGGARLRVRLPWQGAPPAAPEAA